MSVVLNPYLQCDTCPKRLRLMRGENLVQLRNRARRRRWTAPMQGEIKHQCPDCSKAK